MLNFWSTWNLKSSFELKRMPKCFWWGYFLMVLLLKATGRWELFFVLLEKNNFICLVIGIRIKLHFPLKSPFTIFFKVNLILLQIYLYHELFRKGKYHQQKFYIMMLFHQEDHLWKSKTKEVVILTFALLQILFFSNQTFDHLILLLVYNDEDNL